MNMNIILILYRKWLAKPLTVFGAPKLRAMFLIKWNGYAAILLCASLIALDHGRSHVCDIL